MKPRFIYFIRPVGMPGPIKIGLSERTEERVIDLAAWSPFELEIVAKIPGDYQLELNIHECFADAYLRREWFTATDKLLRAIAALQEGKPVEEAIDLTDRVGKLPRIARKPQHIGQGRVTRRVGLTPREWDCLNFIRQHFDENEVAPSYEEIGAAIGVVSRSAVHRLVHSLERRGRIVMVAGEQRSIALPQDRKAA